MRRRFASRRSLLTASMVVCGVSGPVWNADNRQKKEYIDVRARHVHVESSFSNQIVYDRGGLGGGGRGVGDGVRVSV